MKNQSNIGCLLGALGALSLMLVGATAFAADIDGSWLINSDRSEISFESDAPMESFSGTTDQVEGTVEFQSDDPTATSGEISFPVDSLRTGNSTRDRHLTQQEWFYAEEYPDISFTIEEYQDVEVAESEDRVDYRGTAEGTVTIRGVEQTEEADVEVAILPEKDLARVQFDFQFALADYDVEGADGVVGEKVGEVIDVEGTLYADKE